MTAGAVQPRARQRVLDAAYELFARRGVRAVGVNEVVAHAGVAKATLYRHFPSKDDLVLAFLEERDRRWTRGWIEAETDRRGGDPVERLLGLFDLLDEWFAQSEFEGCSFINVLLETGDRSHRVGSASASHLENIRMLVQALAEEAGLDEPEEFSHLWHLLMKGAVIAAAEGDLRAAKRAKALGRLALERRLPARAAAQPTG